MNISGWAGSNSSSVVIARPTDGSEVQALLRRCVAGGPEAWRDLHRSFFPVVQRFARGMGVAAEDLPDVCQEVFIQVFRYLNTFKGEADFKTWLYRICLSQVSRVRQRRRIVGGLLRAFRLQMAVAAPAGPVALTSGTIERAQAAIAGLKPHLREAFVLYEIEGLDGAEIAAVLRCPMGTVRRRLHQARRQIEDALGVSAGSEEAA